MIYGFILKVDLIASWTTEILDNGLLKKNKVRYKVNTNVTNLFKPFFTGKTESLCKTENINIALH